MLESEPVNWHQFLQFSIMKNHIAVLNDHERLNVLLKDLRVVSHWDANLLQEMQVRIKLSFELQSLKQLLQRHFETEESGAYMDEIRSRAPSAAVPLRKLQAEHPLLLEKLSELNSTCIQKELMAAALVELLQELTSILDLLKQHEAKETELIKSVFQV